MLIILNCISHQLNGTTVYNFKLHIITQLYQMNKKKLNNINLTVINLMN